MASPIFALAGTMLNALQMLDSIAQNVANTNTVGYKKELQVTRQFDHFLAPATEKVVDHRPGALKYTGNPLDVAIESESFFEVMTERGPAYTRQGTFRLDARGRLVTESGLPVLGAGGEIVISTTIPVIDAQGRIFDGDRQVGELRTVRFANPQTLVSLGGGLFARGADSEAQSERVERVRQGYLEAANVSSTMEMVRLIETMRQFEASQKVVQGYDGMLDTAIRRLGEF